MRVIANGEQTDYGPLIGYAVRQGNICWALTPDALIVGNNARMVGGRHVFDVVEVRATPPPAPPPTNGKRPKLDKRAK